MRRTKNADTPPATPVIEPGPIAIHGVCELCGKGGPIPAEVHISLKVADGKREMRTTLHAKVINHTCGFGWDGTGEAADPDQLGFGDEQ